MATLHLFLLINLFALHSGSLGNSISTTRLHLHTLRYANFLYKCKNSIQRTQFTCASITQCFTVTHAIYFTKDLIYLLQFFAITVRSLLPCSHLLFLYLCHIFSPTFTLQKLYCHFSFMILYTLLFSLHILAL